MSALPNSYDSQEIFALEQTADTAFDPSPHFGAWWRSLEDSRNRTVSRPPAYLEDHDHDFWEAVSLDDQLSGQICSAGTLVVTEQGKLRADVEVTTAVIDGLFKGKITATEQVVLENHALVIGDINTPSLTIRGGAIIEGRCYFEPPAQDEASPERWEPVGWRAFKVGFAKVWRARFQ
jgi:hypothetical protein